MDNGDVSAVFQYSVGDAWYGDVYDELRSLIDFQYSVGDAAVNLPDDIAAVLHFQYSVGDAGRR